jgi:hypothetical protein
MGDGVPHVVNFPRIGISGRNAVERRDEIFRARILVEAAKRRTFRSEHVLGINQIDH